MKNKLLEKLKRINCPNEYSLDCECVGNCTSEQMGKCWDKTLEGYEILTSKEHLYNYYYENITFAFKRKKKSCDCYEEKDRENEEKQVFSIVKKLVDKFNLEITEDEIRAVIKEIKNS